MLKGFAFVVVVLILLTVPTSNALAATVSHETHDLLTHNQSSNKNSATNQTGVAREIVVEWMETQSGQDRFYPDFIIVNQWDTIHLTFINNDTVMHNFVIGPPYNIMVNASVPGLLNDLTQEVVTQPALGNSPGVVVTGTPGNVSATYTFVAKYAGIFEYVCSYHVQLGMIGYLVVLGPGSTVPQPSTSNETAPSGVAIVQAIIDPGSGTNVNDPGYTPDIMTLILGINNTVEWRNNDTMAHTVSAIDGSFDSGNMQPGAVYTHTFIQPGTYNYVCVYHHWMHGSVTVLASGNSTTQESQSQTSESNATVTLSMYQVYGIAAIGIVILLALMIFWSRKSHSDQK